MQGEINMNILDKLEESLYDIFGMVIPGMLVLLILYIFFNMKPTDEINFAINPILNLFINLDNKEYLAQLPTTFSPFQTTFITFAAYITGHVIKYFSSKFYKYVYSDFFKKDNLNFKTHHKYMIPAKYYIDDIYEYGCELQNVTANICKCFNKCIKKSSALNNFEKNKTKFILNHARSISRIDNIKTLIPKYVAKYNFYCSLAFIFLLMSISSIFSLAKIILNYFNHNSPMLIIQAVIFIVINILFFIVFNHEYFRHCSLYEKESYMILLNYINKNEISKISFNGNNQITTYYDNSQKEKA